jgi:hypothetical protein
MIHLLAIIKGVVIYFLLYKKIKKKIEKKIQNIKGYI